ncbi:MAG: BrnT family toxin [Burkholderiaceae bacterium]|nr:BrnT family toxin [Burkholderiaceae bacterium]
MIYTLPMNIGGFDWDSGNWPKCAEHGVSREEIEQVLADARIAPDPKRSQQEARYIAVGRNGAGRPMFVAFAVRWREGQFFIRPISARYMHAKEVKRYEEST